MADVLNMNFLDFFGFKVSISKIDEIVDVVLLNQGITVVNTINPHSYVLSKTDYLFNSALNNSDILLPDGSGIIFAIRVLHGLKVKKVAGYDLFFTTMLKLNNISGSVFFLGSSNSVLNEIVSKAAIDFPLVRINTFSPPYKNEFSDDDLDSFVDKINEFNPDVVFVGMTAPKQEKVIENINQRINAKMISGIGAVFDFYTGRIKRPSQFWINMNLEWLIRLIGEPKRLWRRNFVSTPIFLMDVLKQAIKNKIKK